jgi:hypothetical protein
MATRPGDFRPVTRPVPEDADHGPSNRKRVVKLSAKITRVDGSVEHRSLIDLTKES